MCCPCVPSVDSVPVPECLAEQHLVAFVKDVDVGLAVPAAVEI